MGIPILPNSRQSFLNPLTSKKDIKFKIEDQKFPEPLPDLATGIKSRATVEERMRYLDEYITMKENDQHEAFKEELRKNSRLCTKFISNLKVLVRESKERKLKNLDLKKDVKKFVKFSLKGRILKGISLEEKQVPIFGRTACTRNIPLL